MNRQVQSSTSREQPPNPGGPSLARWVMIGLGLLLVTAVIGFVAARDSSSSLEWLRAGKREPNLVIVPSPAYSYHQLRASGSVVSGARIVWSVNGEDVSEGTLLDPDHFGRGDLIQARLEVATGAGQSEVTAMHSITIANSPPRIHSARIEREPSRPTQLVAQVEASDPDGDLLDYRLAWKIDGKVWEGGQGRVIDIARLRRGQVVTVDVVVDDGADQAKATSQPFSLDNQPPTLDIAESPILEDAGDGGQRAVLHAMSHDPDGDPVTIEAIDAPDGVHFDRQLGALVWAVNDGSQVFDVILRARDERGGSAERTITLRR